MVVATEDISWTTVTNDELTTVTTSEVAKSEETEPSDELETSVLGMEPKLLHLSVVK